MYDPYEDLVKMTNKRSMIHKIKSIPTIHDKVIPKSRKPTTHYQISDVKDENSKNETPNQKPKSSRKYQY